jgi:C-terminal processing protease CtpA/Prc
MRGNGHTVGGVIVGSPADAAMVLRDDRILTVDGRSMDDMTTQEVRLR